jgi:hypothetical protein
VNQHIAKAYHDYTAEHENFEQLLSWHLCFGSVVSCDRFFAMGYPCDSENPLQAVEPHHADTLFVTYATGDMRSALATFVQDYDFIAFQRSFKNSDKLRSFNMSDFYSKLR